MIQIVHDLAPRADIAFASAFNGERAFANNIGKLAEAGAKVIADDVFYLKEPYFQDGPVAVAVNEAVGGRRHLLLRRRQQQPRRCGRAPNRLLGNARNTETLEAVPRRSRRSKGRTASTSTRLADGSDLRHQSRPGATLTVDLQWDEPWLGVGTDLDAFLLNSSGNLIALRRGQRRIQPETNRDLRVGERKGSSGPFSSCQPLFGRQPAAQVRPARERLRRVRHRVPPVEWGRRGGPDDVRAQRRGQRDLGRGGAFQRQLEPGGILLPRACAARLRPG